MTMTKPRILKAQTSTWTQGDAWTRHGFSLLWDPTLLESIIDPGEVVSLRGLMMGMSEWPFDELPGCRCDSDALVVSGLGEALDSLGGIEEQTRWLEEDLKQAVLKFQEEYQGEAALIFWLPAGPERLELNKATGEYLWHPNIRVGYDASSKRASYRGDGDHEVDYDGQVPSSLPEKLPLLGLLFPGNLDELIAISPLEPNTIKAGAGTRQNLNIPEDRAIMGLHLLRVS